MEIYVELDCAALKLHAASVMICHSYYIYHTQKKLKYFTEITLTNTVTQNNNKLIFVL